jgi:hypothetical protein
MPTILGLVVLPLALLWAGRPERLVQLALVASVFEAGAAFVVGGFGVPVAMVPALVLVVYVTSQYLLGMRYPGEAAALHALLPLLLLLAYALTATILLPDVFAGRVIVFPQKADHAATGAVPLAPSGGNLTQAAYLVANVTFAGVAAMSLTRANVAWRSLLHAYLAGGYLVVGICIWEFAARVGGLPFPSGILYSNPGWAIVEQKMGLMPRIQGPFPEPSALATYMSGLALSCLWLCVCGHQVMRPHILLGLAVLSTLLSTSTTGIVALALGLPALLVYAIGRVDAARLQRATVLLGSILFVGLVLLGPFFLLQPELMDQVNIVLDQTMSKSESDSFIERQEMNNVAWDAVVTSWGFGIGWGSTRTSGLLPGVLAGSGVFGLAMMIWLGFRIRRLVQRADAVPSPGHPAQAVLDGFAAALCGQLIAAALSAPTITSVAFYLQLGVVVAGATRILAEAAARRGAPRGRRGLHRDSHAVPP